MLNHTVRPRLINHELFGACQKWSWEKEERDSAEGCVTTWHKYRKTSCTEGRQNGSIQDSVSRISNANQISNIQEIFFT